ncbi:GH39 family glycosyl hydrolase [Allostreptomyces psammosilenae]|uniref:Glycosyl hydrolases family 39 N-terminal catalytic domain-containing protein n=1 Tax=Allostreptomyces psammosilenae TaxID=1892865 RepID=A0A853A0H5_9ACTN|nr:hypothetical protein [Allostreptomyces psammosilenae]NYI08123.1 hypothetical protein [Allostreptomyces psammosilenae]
MAAASAIAALLLLVPVVASRAPGREGEPKPAAEEPRNPPRWGITHTQYSAEFGDEAAVDDARELLAGETLVQNQHIMGWGAMNPEPSPGVHDFAALDARMEIVRATGGHPVITLCCAPDWMKGGEPGSTDWDLIEVAVAPEHFDDFAELAATVARRYPEVRDFIVWNEFKGFWNDSENRWDYEGYTEMYNRVYDTLKAVDPDIRVGGPYLSMEAWSHQDTTQHSDVAGEWGVLDKRVVEAFDYWLAHKHGADFVVVDGSMTTRDQGLVTDEFTATEYFADISRWVKSRTDLPLWWAEWYVESQIGTEQWTDTGGLFGRWPMDRTASPPPSPAGTPAPTGTPPADPPPTGTPPVGAGEPAAAASGWEDGGFPGYEDGIVPSAPPPTVPAPTPQHPASLPPAPAPPEWRAGDHGVPVSLDERRRTAVQAVAMMEMVRGGVDVSLYWNPQTTGGPCPGCLWSPTDQPGGGQVMPMLDVLQGFARAFPAGTPLHEVRVSGGIGGEVAMLAQRHQVVLVNTSDRQAVVRIGDVTVTLQPYEVRGQNICGQQPDACPPLAAPAPSPTAAATPSSLTAPGTAPSPPPAVPVPSRRDQDGEEG